jgi:hypothetical protein
MNNTKFDKLTNAQKRVALAKDVIAWVKAGALIPDHVVYVRPTILPDHYPFFDRSSEVQANAVNWGKCKVCARGALFVAKVAHMNNCLAQDFLSVAGSVEAMDGLFEDNQFYEIECAYEGWQSFFPLNNKNLWTNRYPDDSERMIAIMKNIIRNKGTFRLNEVEKP